ncbi:unnamed protein product [Vicia faba]|uniref:Uncharacterized protein n=1 Tax=Vicia faba TaxID=3906 RepID=A0AAV0ZZ12_VICFA|nr:unnamed protein product [Vicia faba]
MSNERRSKLTYREHPDDASDAVNVTRNPMNFSEYQLVNLVRRIGVGYRSVETVRSHLVKIVSYSVLTIGKQWPTVMLMQGLVFCSWFSVLTVKKYGNSVVNRLRGLCEFGKQVFIWIEFVQGCLDMIQLALGARGRLLKGAREG